MIVVDTSVYIDAIFLFSERSKISKEFFKIAKFIKILEPEIFKIELISQLVRRVQKEEALKIFEDIISKVEVISLEHLKELAFTVAFETGCRAIDSYFIATAKLTNSILITNDKIMNENAKKYGVESYYLIEEFEKVEKRIKEMK